MKLYLVRHGQSEANAGEYVSTAKTVLTEQGILDAKKAGELLRGVQIDKIFVSPYTRAIQTAENALPGREYEIADCLHEADCGQMEGHSWAEMRQKHGDGLDEMLKVDDFTRVGGEDYKSVQARARQFMAIVENCGCERVAAFSHAGLICAFFEEVIDKHTKVGRNYNLDNGSVNVFEVKNGRWKCIALNVTQDVFK